MPHSYCYLEWFRQGFFTDDLTCDESVVQFLNDAYKFVRDSIVFEDFPKLVVHCQMFALNGLFNEYDDSLCCYLIDTQTLLSEYKGVISLHSCYTEKFLFLVALRGVLCACQSSCIHSSFHILFRRRWRWILRSCPCILRFLEVCCRLRQIFHFWDVFWLLLLLLLQYLRH